MADEKNQEQTNQTQTSQAGAGEVPDKGRPTEVISDKPSEDKQPNGLINRTVTRRDGVKVGQQLPAEDSAVNEARVKAEKAYFETREECPRCHVADGFVKGGTNCNSCGYSKAADLTASGRRA
jgi:hypothetical protein